MSRRRRLILLALIVVLLLAASATAELAFGGLPLPQPPAGTAWVLRQYTSGGSSVSLPDGRAITLMSKAQGHEVYGNSGCNYYNGTYSSYVPGRLSISGLMRTMALCRPVSIDEFETHYLSDLRRVDSYRLFSANLILTGDGGRLSMAFSPSA